MSTHSIDFVELSLQLVNLSLEEGLGLVETAGVAVQILNLPVEFKVLLGESCLPAVEVVVLPRQLVQLSLEAPQLVLEPF